MALNNAETANMKTTEPTAVLPAPSIKWTTKLKFKAVHLMLTRSGVSDDLIAAKDLDQWAKLYELLVGSPPPKA